jgi:short-subunit dehydrogenase
MDWSGKVVLITGASSGIGRGLALELARRGAGVGLVARRADLLEQLAHEVNQLGGGRAVALPADVESSQALRQEVHNLRSALGPVDVLIASAGIATTADAADLRPADVAQVVNTNVLGAVNSVAAVLPEMVARGSGHLVAISSLAGYRGLPKSAAYCASKAALAAFFESLRLDLGGRGIDVSVIYPGFIKTPLTAGRKAQMPFLMELDDAVKKMVVAIEKRRKNYAFPWQLATVVKAGLIMPAFMYDYIAARNSFRE